MKQFVHAILSAAALATLAGCATNQEETLFPFEDPLRDEIAKDVDKMFYAEAAIDSNDFVVDVVYWMEE